MNKRCLIFGINGQDGYYLKQILESECHTVIGISRSEGDHVTGSIASYEFVKQLIITHQPVYIFHFAANSTAAHDAIFENHQTISGGTTYILEAVKQFSPHTKVFLSGSCLQFENKGLPIKETDSFAGNSIYAVERIYSVYAARYFRQLGLKVYVGYFFHHDSPFRRDSHLNMKIIKTALKIKAGEKKTLEIGNPDVIKEFNHAYDMMRAVWLLVTQDEIFEAVIGSGIGYKISEWIDICFEKIGIKRDGHIKLNTAYKPDFNYLVSNPETIKTLGWRPLYNIHELAIGMINNA